MSSEKKYCRACAGCIYMGWAGWYGCCNYLFMTDKRRPCPPGKNCTVKTTRKRGRKKKVEATNDD